MAVVALVALIVIGPKDLPQAMRSASKWVRKARSLAREFQSGVDDMIREADLEDARKAVQSAKNLDIDKALRETVDPKGEVSDEARDLERTARSDGIQPERPDTKTSTKTPNEDEEGARIVEQPVSVAPAHSIKPPDEGKTAPEASPDKKSKSA